GPAGPAELDRLAGRPAVRGYQGAAGRRTGDHRGRGGGPLGVLVHAGPRRPRGLIRSVAAEQLGFEGMPRRLYSCTPSRLNTWLDCPRRYRMTYLDRPAPPKGAPWAHNSLGAAVHNALAGWWRLPQSERTPELAGTLLVKGWLTDGFRDAEQSLRSR